MIEVRNCVGDLSPRGWVLFAATALTMGGLGTGALILSYLPAAVFLLPMELPEIVQKLVLLLFVGLGTFVSGAVVWWALIEQPQTVSTRRGVAVGILTVVLAQISSILVVELIQFLPRLFRIPGLASSVGGFLTSLIVLVISTISFTLGIALLSLALFGVILFPVGIGIGLLLAQLREPTIGETAPSRTAGDSAE